MQASKNFKWEELECKCGCGTRYISQAAIDKLQAVRDDLNIPLTINSAARCPKHNAAVGGAARSKHLSYKVEMNGNVVESTAFDVSTVGIDQKKVIEAAYKAGFNGIGIYKTFVHMDVRVHPFQWHG